MKNLFGLFKFTFDKESHHLGRTVYFLYIFVTNSIGMLKIEFAISDSVQVFLSCG